MWQNEPCLPLPDKPPLPLGARSRKDRYGDARDVGAAIFWQIQTDSSADFVRVGLGFGENFPVAKMPE